MRRALDGQFAGGFHVEFGAGGAAEGDLVGAGEVGALDRDDGAAHCRPFLWFNRADGRRGDEGVAVARGGRALAAAGRRDPHVDLARGVFGALDGQFAGGFHVEFRAGGAAEGDLVGTGEVVALDGDGGAAFDRPFLRFDRRDRGRRDVRVAIRRDRFAFTAGRRHAHVDDGGGRVRG